MNTITKLKTAATVSALPTFQQAVAMALAKAEWDLKYIINTRRNDEQWDDNDVDVDYAVELALCHVQSMKAVAFADFDHFSTDWYKAAAAINLGIKIFSRNDCAYIRCLKCAGNMFQQTADMVEFVEMS